MLQSCGCHTYSKKNQQIRQRSNEDLVMRWKFSLKSRLEVVFFASIPWLSHRSKEKSTDPAKIQRRFNEIWRWFSKDLEVETHSDFDRHDRCSSETDPTWPKVVRGQQQVVQPPTRCEWVDSKPNPDWPVDTLTYKIH